MEFEVSRDEQNITEEETETNVVEETAEVTVTPQSDKTEDEITVYTKRGYTETSQQNPHLSDDRKKVLAGLSYRFGHKQKIEEMEQEPAYKRKGIELSNNKNYSAAADLSRYTVGNDDLSRPEIKRNNSFLHDKPD